MFTRIIRMPFYAVAKGRAPGIYKTWSECESQVKGFSGAKYKKVREVDSGLKTITDFSTFSSTLSQKRKVLLMAHTSQTLQNVDWSLLRQTLALQIRDLSLILLR